MKNSTTLEVVSLITKIVAFYQNQERDFSKFSTAEKQEIKTAWSRYFGTFDFEFCSFRARYTDLIEILLETTDAMLFNLMLDINEDLEADKHEYLCQKGMYLSAKLFHSLSMSFVESNEDALKNDMVKFYQHLDIVANEFDEYRWMQRKLSTLITTDTHGQPQVDMEEVREHFTSVAILLQEYFLNLEDYISIARGSKEEIALYPLSA